MTFSLGASSTAISQYKPLEIGIAYGATYRPLLELHHWQYYVVCSTQRGILTFQMKEPTVVTFNSCTKWMGSPGIIPERLSACSIANQFPGHAWMTSQLKVTFIPKLCGSLMCLAYIFDMLSKGVCTTRHWQVSGQPVQEVNVCIHVSTVPGKPR